MATSSALEELRTTASSCRVIFIPSSLLLLLVSQDSSFRRCCDTEFLLNRHLAPRYSDRDLPPPWHLSPLICPRIRVRFAILFLLGSTVRFYLQSKMPLLHLLSLLYLVFALLIIIISDLPLTRPILLHNAAISGDLSLG